MEQKKKRTRVKDVNMANYLYKHSPLKNGVKIKNEDAPLSKYNKICSKIYLGNIQCAKDKDFFKNKNIKAVLNCSKDIPNYFYNNNKDIEYLRIPVDDSLKQVDFDKMFEFFPIATEFINKHVNLQKNNILIHCYAGRQRSAICVAAYLVKFEGMKPHKACKMILDKRPEAFHHGLSLNFDQSLQKFSKKLLK
jgi:protein-tyrosine phosphatase